MEDINSFITSPSEKRTGEEKKKKVYETGKELGKKLRALEERWIKNNFVIDKDNLKKSLEKLN